MMKKVINSADIGFKIAPLINAVGRISDPKLIIELLTNNSDKIIKKLTTYVLFTNISKVSL